MNINDIKLNPNNPRFIKDDRYQKLKNSIKDFPKMMKLRPIIIDDDGMILGGNMRYLVMRDLGYEEIPKGWVVKASELTEEERKRFIITDNIPYGDWDEDKLANEWDIGELQEWGVDIPEINNIEEDFNEKEVDENIETENECPKCGYKW
jgi:ParB-like chromosome segregation protein Spo0J